MKQDSIIHEKSDLLGSRVQKILNVPTGTSVVFCPCRAADIISFHEC